MTRLDLGHITLNAVIDGPEDMPWLVLSNSLGSNLSMWDPQMPMLTRGYRVLRYDSRGHGGSDAPPGPYSFDDLVGDVIALMDHHSIEKAAFMGLSKGGMTGLGLALDHSDRIERVVCADARADAPDAFRDMWDQRMAAVKNGGLEAIVEGTLAAWLTEDFRAEKPALVESVRQMILGTDPAGYVASCQALKRLDYLRHLGDVTIPVLYVGGANDMAASPQMMQAMADATPGGQYVEIPGAAHVANINAPQAFNAAVSDFLGL